MFCLFYWDYLQSTLILVVLVVYVLLFIVASLHLYIVCVVIIVFCELLYYGCPLCAFLPAAFVVFMLLFAIAGAQWRIASADCATACSAASVAEASKVRFKGKIAIKFNRTTSCFTIKVYWTLLSSLVTSLIIAIKFNRTTNEVIDILWWPGKLFNQIFINFIYIILYVSTYLI